MDTFGRRLESMESEAQVRITACKTAFLRFIFCKIQWPCLQEAVFTPSWVCFNLYLLKIAVQWSPSTDLNNLFSLGSYRASRTVRKGCCKLLCPSTVSWIFLITIRCSLYNLCLIQTHVFDSFTPSPSYRKSHISFERRNLRKKDTFWKTYWIFN